MLIQRNCFSSFYVIRAQIYVPTAILTLSKNIHSMYRFSVFTRVLFGLEDFYSLTHTFN